MFIHIGSEQSLSGAGVWSTHTHWMYRRRSRIASRLAVQRSIKIICVYKYLLPPFQMLTVVLFHRCATPHRKKTAASRCWGCSRNGTRQHQLRDLHEVQGCVANAKRTMSMLLSALVPLFRPTGPWLFFARQRKGAAGVHLVWAAASNSCTTVPPSQHSVVHLGLPKET